VLGHRYDPSTWYLSAPGTWQVSVDPIDGFAPVEPRMVEVRAGEIADVTIELRRTP
jgi:hypothetical protein